MSARNAHGPESDALVIFGITGDLAYKKIFPALQNLVQRGRLARSVEVAADLLPLNPRRS